jgi:protein-S-isoprenylcysteine O-methyltransferase Ste14
MALQQEFEQQGNWLFKYRGQVPVVLLIAQLILFYWQAAHASLPFKDPMTWNIVCLVICMAGQLIRLMVIGYTPKNTSGRNTREQVADVVNQTGIYSVVRHPLYLGNFFMWLGVAMISQNLAFVVIFTLAFWIFYERIMYAEEQFLTRRFGAVYAAWAERVPAFIPRLHGWVSSPAAFSLKNIIKRESVGFFNVFLVFWIFSATLNWIEKKNFNTNDPWFLTFIAISAITIIIYVLRKKTNLLSVEGR